MTKVWWVFRESFFDLTSLLSTLPWLTDPFLTAVTDLHYLPCLAFFCAIRDFHTVTIERCEYFVKQSFRNRCYINTEHGREALILPLTGKHGKTRIDAVKIDYSQKWLNNHWRSIRSAYGKAPFFAYYEQDLHAVLYRRHTFLYDLNFDLLTMCLNWLKWERAVVESLSYIEQYPAVVSDLRSRITPKDTNFITKVYKPTPYYQVFGNSFADNLSIVDLIFCCGPEASRILEASRVREWTITITTVFLTWY